MSTNKEVIMNNCQKKFLWTNFRELEPHDVIWFNHLLEERLNIKEELTKLCSLYSSLKNINYSTMEEHNSLLFDTNVTKLKINTLIKLIKLA